MSKRQPIAYLIATVRFPLYEGDKIDRAGGSASWNDFVYEEPGVTRDGQFGTCRRDCETIEARIEHSVQPVTVETLNDIIKILRAVKVNDGECVLAAIGASTPTQREAAKWAGIAAARLDIDLIEMTRLADEPRPMLPGDGQAVLDLAARLAGYEQRRLAAWDAALARADEAGREYDLRRAREPAGSGPHSIPALEPCQTATEAPDATAGIVDDLARPR